MEWITKDGRSIPLNELTCDHLSNIITMLERQGINLIEIVQINDISELDFPADEYSDFRIFFERERATQELVQVYHALVEERQRRAGTIPIVTRNS